MNFGAPVAETLRTRPGRIALVLPDLEAGGAERVVLTLAEFFCREGYQVDLLLVARQGALLREIPSAVHLVALTSAVSTKGRHLLGGVAVAGRMRYLLRVRPVAVVSALTGANLLSALTARIAGLAGWRGVVILAEHNVIRPGGSGWRSLAMRSLFAHADVLVAVSSGIADDLARLLGRHAPPVVVINNPVDGERLRMLANESPVHPWFLDRSVRVIVAVGRLVPEKDYPTLLAAFARLRGNQPDLRLVILGEGIERFHLEALIDRLGLGDCVALPGFVCNPYPCIRAARLFAMSSRAEGYPLAILEALALGVPVVATDCHSGPREILQSGRFGRLVPVEDPMAMADAIAATLDEPMPARGCSVVELSGPGEVARRYLALVRGCGAPPVGL